MKKKEIKKLSLNKITVFNLKDIKAGAITTATQPPETNPGALDTEDSCPDTLGCIWTIDFC